MAPPERAILRVILAVNSGSSSLRVATFEGTQVLARKAFERGEGDLAGFGEPEEVSIEPSGGLEIAHEERDVSELADFHDTRDVSIGA